MVSFADCNLVKQAAAWTYTTAMQVAPGGKLYGDVSEPFSIDFGEFLRICGQYLVRHRLRAAPGVAGR